MKYSFSITKDQIHANIKAVQELLVQKGLDACYVSSFDPFLNEYVPLEDCHRYYITGFTGSMAEVLVPAKGKVMLFVDGRYHEQADLEVDLDQVEVVKCRKQNTTEVIDRIKQADYKKVGYEAARTALGFFQRLKVVAELTSFNSEISELLSKPEEKTYPAVELVGEEHRGSGTMVKLGHIFNGAKDVAHYVTALDTIAWLTNCRGYHLPFLSSFLGRALVTHDKVYIFVEPNITVADRAKAEPGLNFISCTADGIRHQLEQIQKRYNLATINYDPGMLNVADFQMLGSVFDSSSLKSLDGGLVEFQAIKDEGEIKEFIDSFHRASKAVYNTIKWVKSGLAADKKISELDLYKETSAKYKEQGAITQSFNTISGVGPNGSIIHYSSPKKDLHIKKDDMILLDSGGYFAGGFATDTTRTFTGGAKKINDEYKRMYTLVLKGFVACHSAIFPEGLSGGILDGLARMPLYKNGANYNHGTGHGVGIHVHEGGAGLSPVRNCKMKAGQVVSIEPGYYTPGFGGVRIENVAVVEKHPQFEGYLYFKPLTLVGLEPDLIDESLLTSEEKEWLTGYESECKALGTSFA